MATVEPGTIFESLDYFGTEEEILLADKILSGDSFIIQKLNPQNNNFNVRLPDIAIDFGMVVWITNSSIGTGNLNIRNVADTETIGTIGPSQNAYCICVNNVWNVYMSGGGGGGGGAIEWKLVEVNTNMVDEMENIILTSVEYTLLAAPVFGNTVNFAVGSDWEGSNPTIKANGNNIMGLSDDLACNLNRAFSLTYQDVARGWILSN